MFQPLSILSRHGRQLPRASVFALALATLAGGCTEDEGNTGGSSLGGGGSLTSGLTGLTGSSASTEGTNAGASGGTTAGATVGSTAGTVGGVTAGVTAGTSAGVTAGTTAGTTAGITAGTTAGATAGTTGGDGGAGSTSSTNGGSGDYYADPVIPAVSGECPSFQSGSFSFMGLSGEMEVGSKGSGDGALLFYWHGTGGSAGGFRSPFAGIGSDNINKITSQGGIIFAVQGATGSGDRSCSGTAVFDGDFSVIDQVVACAVQNHDINPRRIYATGCSAGGLQSGCMATRRSDYVAAVAPNSGGLVSSFGASLSNSASGNVPASMTMHGGAGDNVGINFGTSSESFNNLITGQGGFAVDCNHMSGHCGAPGDLYDLAIDFLLDHPFGVDPYPYAGGLPSDFPSYCSIQ